MTAPAPTLLEQATIDRLGVFDEEIIAELENHADDVVACFIPGCGKTIHWRVSMRCCGAAAEFCDHHGKRTIAKLRARLRTTRIPVCLTCDHVFPVGSLLEDIARVVAR